MAQGRRGTLFNLAMPPEMLAEVKQAAEADGRTASGWLRQRIREALAAAKAGESYPSHAK